MRDFPGSQDCGIPEGLYATAEGRAWSPAGLYEQPFTEVDYLVPGQSNGVPRALWDPAEELGFQLQETMSFTRPSAARQPQEDPFHPVAPPHGDSFGREVQDVPAPLAADLPGGRLPPGGRAAPPRRRARRNPIDWSRATSRSIATVMTALVTMVSVCGALIAYDPLRQVAELRTAGDVASWWPLLVYGPWAVASLSILRAAIHQRRAVHSWLVVLIFSGTAMLLCLTQAHRSVTDAAAAALPHVASFACFHQLVRLITLTKPPRKPNPRHRTPLSRTGRVSVPAAPPASREASSSKRAF